MGTNRLASLTDSSGTRSFNYDARGNTSAEARPGSVAVSTSYNAYGPLTVYSRTGDPTQANTYNGLDDRVSVTSGSVTHAFVYDPDGRVLGEYGASASDVIAETIWLSPEVAANDNQPLGGDDGIGGYAPLAVVTGSGTSAATYWIHGNQMGVPIVTTDATGATATPPAYTMPGFPGQMRTLADLYYNRYRDYDSSTGRYIQGDPIGLEGGENPYLYAEGNPLSYMDPTGEFGFVGALIGGGSDLAIQLILNGGNWKCVNWIQVGISTALGAVGGGALGGAFKWKRGSNAWSATRKWLGRTGFAKPGEHGHHWLIEQNSYWGKKIPEWFKNQPWNINPISGAFHRTLHRLPSPVRTIAGAPSWVKGVGVGIGISAGGERCGCE